MSFHLQVSDQPFEVVVEPEGMTYAVRPGEAVVLTFRGRSAMLFSVEHATEDIIVFWRPADTEVWAATSTQPDPVQIGGYAGIPAPWLESDSQDPEPPQWTHLDLPPYERWPRSRRG